MNVLVASHTFNHGVQHELVDYLRQAGTGCTGHLSNPLPETQIETGELLDAELTIWQLDGSVETRRTSPVRQPAALAYFCDFLRCIRLTLTSGRYWHVYIGADGINALAGLVLRALGRVERVVFYGHSYRDAPYGSRLLNAVYRAIDRRCRRGADMVWNLSDHLTGVRREQGVPDSRNVTVPIGVNFGRVPRKPVSEARRQTLVFSGMFGPKSGLELVIRAMPALLESTPGLQLVVVGGGGDEQAMRDLVASLKVGNAVRFTGLLSHNELLREVSQCGIGLAPYSPIDNTMMRSTDPTKPKEYMACGLPVIMTRVPANADELERRHAGILIEYTPEALAVAVQRLVDQPELYAGMREGALAYASDFDWARIFSEAFGRSCINLRDDAPPDRNERAGP